MKHKPEYFLRGLPFHNERHWIRRGERAALALFHETAERVPAYARFLKEHGVRSRSIRTIADFSKLPTTDKANYLRKYPLAELSWDGKLTDRHHVISATSGSTGKPFYFPRSAEQDDQYALTAELYLRTNFHIDKKRTLYINAFPLGIWIGGLFTYAAITEVARRRNYPLSVINPGINAAAVVDIVKRFGGDYDQLLIGGYGPFTKDILDQGTLAGIRWDRLDIGFIFSAEGFSEDFRDHILAHTRKRGMYTATLNHYGTVDLGTMSYETPLAILARRTILGHPSLRTAIFHESHKVPTVTQFIPELFYFEETPDHSLLCSARSGLPLIRYDLKDYGHVYTKSTLEQEFREEGIALDKLAEHGGIAQTVWNLPFVQVFERKDFSVSFYAFQIYPETVRRAIDSRAFRSFCTGKFTMRVAENKHHDPVFEVHVELMPGKRAVPAPVRRKLEHAITERLLEESSEYKKTFTEKGGGVLPKITFWTHGHPEHFLSGGKQKWVK